MDFLHETVKRPRCCNPDLTQPKILRQNGLRKTQSDRQSAWFLKSDVEAGNHAAIHINGKGQKRAPDRQTVNVIDQDQIQGRVVNLDNAKRRIAAIERSVQGLDSLRCMATFAPAQFNSARDFMDAPP
jgi:hypothetical protein